MNSATDLQSILASASMVKRDELQYMAYSGQFEQVHTIFKRIPSPEWSDYSDKYILHQTVWGGIQRMRKLLSVHNDKAAHAEKVFICDVVALFVDSCRTSGIFPRELFQTLLYWSDELVQLTLADEALELVHIALELGCNKFPGFQLQFLSRMARIATDKGNFEEASVILSQLAGRPYLLTDRAAIPGLLYELAQTSLRTGNIPYYKQLLFLGLRYFYTDNENRREFVEQISHTWRRSWRVLFSRDVSLTNKLLFVTHWLYYKLPDLSRFRLGFINRVWRMLLLGVIYALNYLRRDQSIYLQFGQTPPTSAPSKNGQFLANGTHRDDEKLSFRRRQRILITRAMGGIGDLLMMTPGIHALKQKYPDQEIVMAVPKNYFAVFRNNPDVTLVDIENAPLNHAEYRRWVNFTDCPASRVESRTAPHVKKTRVDIFAQALGIQGLQLWQMDKRPRYFVTDEEHAFAEDFLAEQQLEGRQIIGIQLQADETYRDYPYMEKATLRLAEQHKVLIFDAKPIAGYHHPNIIKVDRYSIRQAFALASKCSVILAPDSAFVHLSAAFNIPCVALFGPIDGHVRTKQYPHCTYLDASDQLGCVSCWRNEMIPCKLTKMRGSVCMGEIPISKVVATVCQHLAKGHLHETAK